MKERNKFPSNRGGTIGESCHYRAWQLHRWAKYVPSHPPHCAAELSPCTPLGVRWDELITLFAGAMRRHNAGLKEQDRDKEVHNWTLSLEPGTSRRHAGSYSSIFILMAKQRRLICLGLGFHSRVLPLKYLFFGGGKLFHSCSFFLILSCFLCLGPTLS